MKKVLCIGEVLIDLVSIDGKNYAKKPGGAPANVAVAVSKLGGKGTFLGAVGKDSFGNYLKGVLEENNVDISHMDYVGKTTLALVSIDENGERSFDFYRGSDSEYSIDIKSLEINENYIIHFGSATAFLDGKLNETYHKLLEEAKKKGAFISFDPNYRDVLITEDIIEDYKEKCWNFIKKADFIKLSDVEAMFLTETNSLEEVIKKLKLLNLGVIAITLGDKGTLVIENGNSYIVESIKINQKDSTGAGDAFVGGVLYGLANTFEYVNYKEIIKFANVVGAITCEQFGAIPAMPSLENVKDRINYTLLRNNH